MNNTIEPGDILLRPKGQVIDHLAIALGNGFVFQNTPEKGEHLATISEYASGKRVTVRKQPRANRRRTLHSIWDRLHNPRPYDVLNNNCEHPIYEATTGKAKSPQLRIVLTVLGVAVIAATALQKR